MWLNTLVRLPSSSDSRTHHKIIDGLVKHSLFSSKMTTWQRQSQRQKQIGWMLVVEAKRKKKVMAKELDEFNFKQRHGKARVRVGRVQRSKERRLCFMVEWNVNISLLSNWVTAYVFKDNFDIIANDTMKNTSCSLRKYFSYLNVK